MLLGRLLELTGAKDPKALETLVKSVGVRAELVNRDLLTYKVHPALPAHLRFQCRNARVLQVENLVEGKTCF